VVLNRGVHAPAVKLKNGLVLCTITIHRQLSRTDSHLTAVVLVLDLNLLVTLHPFQLLGPGAQHETNKHNVTLKNRKLENCEDQKPCFKTPKLERRRLNSEINDLNNMTSEDITNPKEVNTSTTADVDVKTA